MGCWQWQLLYIYRNDSQPHPSIHLPAHRHRSDDIFNRFTTFMFLTVSYYINDGRAGLIFFRRWCIITNIHKTWHRHWTISLRLDQSLYSAICSKLYDILSTKRRFQYPNTGRQPWPILELSIFTEMYPPAIVKLRHFVIIGVVYCRYNTGIWLPSRFSMKLGQILRSPNSP